MNCVNVIDHGAVGDGVTDDQAAIETAMAVAGVGGMVCFEPGLTYSIATKITIDEANFTLVIPPNTTIQSSSSNTAGRAIDITAVGIRIEGGGTVDHNGRAGSGITADLKNDIVIDDIVVKNVLVRGVSLTACSNYFLHRVRVTWDSGGVTAVIADAPAAIYGFFLLAEDAGPAIEDPNIRQCEVDMTGFTFANLPALSAGFIIRGEEVNNTGRVNRLRFVHNRALLPKATFINWNGKRPFCCEIRSQIDDSVISDNFFEGGESNLSLRDLVRARVSDNECHLAALYGLELVDSDEVIIANNQLNGASQARRPLSINNCNDIIVSGGLLRGGDGTSGGVNIMLNILSGTSGSDRILINGVMIIGAGANTDLIRTSGGQGVTINGCNLRAAGGASNHIRHTTGDLKGLQIIGCMFRGGVRSILNDSGATITDLLAVGNLGLSAGSYLNNGTVTKLTVTGNTGISGI